MDFLLSDSLMCADMLHIGEQLSVLESEMNAHHADVMDGHFAPNLTLSPDFVRAVCSYSKLPVDVHLMVTRPNDWLEVFAKAGADMLTVHAETINSCAFRTIRMIRQLGCKVGVALNPATPLSEISQYIDEIDRLTLMTVDVGYAGQPLVPQVLCKVEEAAKLKSTGHLKYTIQIDGCCNQNTYARYRNAGAEMLVMGSGLFGLDSDLKKAVAMMHEQQREN